LTIYSSGGKNRVFKGRQRRDEEKTVTKQAGRTKGETRTSFELVVEKNGVWRRPGAPIPPARRKGEVGSNALGLGKRRNWEK